MIIDKYLQIADDIVTELLVIMPKLYSLCIRSQYESIVIYTCIAVCYMYYPIIRLYNLVVLKIMRISTRRVSVEIVNILRKLGITHNICDFSLITSKGIFLHNQTSYFGDFVLNKLYTKVHAYRKYIRTTP